MAKKLRVHYWDACCMLSYINGDAARMPDLSSFLEESEKRDIQIATSTLSTVEVAYGHHERSGQTLDTHVENDIAKLWSPGGPVKLVEFHTLIADGARRLIRLGLTQGWALKPPDAIHLATAKAIEADEFNTYDEGLPRYASAIGCEINPPKAYQPKMIL